MNYWWNKFCETPHHTHYNLCVQFPFDKISHDISTIYTCTPTHPWKFCTSLNLKAIKKDFLTFFHFRIVDEVKCFLSLFFDPSCLLDIHMIILQFFLLETTAWNEKISIIFFSTPSLPAKMDDMREKGGKSQSHQKKVKRSNFKIFLSFF